MKQIQHAKSIVPIVSVQNRYSVIDRAAEDVVDYCDRTQIGFIPWFPLASGDVSKSGSSLEDAAAKLKITPSQLALAWLLHRSPVMLPIPGTSRVEHLEENVAAAAVKVDEATLKRTGKVSSRGVSAPSPACTWSPSSRAARARRLPRCESPRQVRNGNSARSRASRR